MAALASASFSAHLSGGNPPHLAYSTSFIHSFIYSYAFIEHLLCVKHFAAYIDDAFPTHRAPPTHTHTSVAPLRFGKILSEIGTILSQTSSDLFSRILF